MPNPPQWVVLNFPTAHTVNKIVLYPQIFETGRTEIRIEANDTGGVWTTVATVDTYMFDNIPVTVSLLKPIPNVVKLRISTLSGVPVVAWREIEPYEGNETVSPLKSFGYYGVETGSGWDEVSALGNSNISFTAASLDLNIMRNLLTKARVTNMPAYINMFEVFFTGEKPATLIGDWQARWNTFKSAIAGYEDALAGFYFDEPL